MANNPCFLPSVSVGSGVAKKVEFFVRGRALSLITHFINLKKSAGNRGLLMGNWRDYRDRPYRDLVTCVTYAELMS